MSLGLSILDELSFAQAELSAVEPLEWRRTIDVTGTLPIVGSNRSFPMPKPFFVRELGRAHLGDAWSAFCGLLRQHGIPIFSSVAAMDNVPAAFIPARWGRRFVNEPLDALELMTADAFEVGSSDRSYQRWGWSSEVGSGRIGEFVRSVRQAAGGDTPVGVGLPMGCHPADLRRCVEADPDFISLIARFSRFEPGDIHCIASLRRLCGELGRSLMPILVAAPIDNADRAIKLLALGASAICLDGLISPWIPASTLTSQAGSSIGGGLLSGITARPARETITLPEIDAALTQLKLELESRMRSVGANNLGQLNAECLRSCSDRSWQVSGVARFGGAE